MRSGASPFPLLTAPDAPQKPRKLWAFVESAFTSTSPLFNDESSTQPCTSAVNAVEDHFTSALEVPGIPEVVARATELLVMFAGEPLVHGIAREEFELKAASFQVASPGFAAEPW